MKSNIYSAGPKAEDEIVAYFGNAKLVRLLDCSFALRGGSNEDQSKARAWISMFLHGAVLKSLDELTSPPLGASIAGGHFALNLIY